MYLNYGIRSRNKTLTKILIKRRNMISEVIFERNCRKNIKRVLVSTKTSFKKDLPCQRLNKFISPSVQILG